MDELFSAAEANIAVLQQFVHQHPQQENKQPYAHNHKQDELRAENKRLKEATRASQAEVKRLKNQIQLDQQAREAEARKLSSLEAQIQELKQIIADKERGMRQLAQRNQELTQRLNAAAY